MQADIAWVCVNRNGHMIVSTVAPLRGEAIKRMVGDETGSQRRWAWWKRNHGMSCQRVRLVPMQEATNG